MKILFLCFFVLITIGNLKGQDYSELKQISLSNAEECKNAEQKVFKLSKFLLNTPCEENIASLNITQFLLEWMGATPEYEFGFEDKFHRTIKSDLALTSRYLAAMSIFAIDNNHKKADKELQFESIKIVLIYSENKKNEVKISKKLGKYIDAKNSGTLVDLINE